MAIEIPEHELEKKRIEFVEWQNSPNFNIDDVEYETVEKFIADCGMTMIPALLSCAAKAAKRTGCFKSDLAAIRFVATAIEEEPQAASACQNNGGIPIQVRFVTDDRGGHIEFGDLVWRPERDR